VADGQLNRIHLDVTPHCSGDQAEIKELWEVIQHPPYSPDIVPLDYYLFRSKIISTDSALIQWAIFRSTWRTFSRKSHVTSTKIEIMSLLERWQKIVDQDGQYILN